MALEVAAAFAAFRRDDPAEIARIQSDDRRDGAAQRRDDDVARLPVGQRLAGLGIDDLEQIQVFHDVQAALMRTFKAAESGFVDPIVVVNLRAERFAQVGSAASHRVGSQKRRNELAVHFGEISIQFGFTDLGQLAEVFWKAHPDVRAEIERHFDLAPGGCHQPAAGGQRHHTQVVVESLVDGPTQIGQPAGGRNLCDVARAGA